jgi:hypothetical protein
MIKFNDYVLSKEEEQVLIAALEMYARAFQGQFSHLAQVFAVNNVNKLPPKQLSEVKEKLEAAQVALHGNTDGSWRISSNFVSRSALKAYMLELILLGDIERAKEVLNLAGFNPLSHDTTFGHSNNLLSD